MSDLGAPHPRESRDGFRLLALVAVSVGLLLLAAAAFALSYSGVHAAALSAAVSPRLARLYPLIFDAMLVVAGAAVLSLRGAGLPSRCYAWLWLLVLLAAVAIADALHATNTRLPSRPASAAAAVIPWALVLIGFSLLLAMLRHARLRRVALPPPEPPVRRGGLAVLGFDSGPADDTGHRAGPGSRVRPEDMPEPEPEPEPEAEAVIETALQDEPGQETFETAPQNGAEQETEAAPGPDALLEFDRVRSSPVPPDA
jgi:uncharacterized membrane protein SirB2